MKRREHRLGITIYSALLYVGSVFAKDKDIIAREYTNMFCTTDRLKTFRRIKSCTKGYDVVPLSISRARKMP